MIKKLFALLLVGIICVSLLCGCGTTTNEHGLKVEGAGRFVFIEETGDDFTNHLAYDRETKIVYFYDEGGYNAGVYSQYLIYQDGAIYGAIYEDGKVIPVPFATTSVSAYPNS